MENIRKNLHNLIINDNYKIDIKMRDKILGELKNYNYKNNSDLEWENPLIARLGDKDIIKNEMQEYVFELFTTNKELSPLKTDITYNNYKDFSNIILSIIDSYGNYYKTFYVEWIVVSGHAQLTKNNQKTALFQLKNQIKDWAIHGENSKEEFSAQGAMDIAKKLSKQKLESLKLHGTKIKYE